MGDRVAVDVIGHGSLRCIGGSGIADIRVHHTQWYEDVMRHGKGLLSAM